MSHPDINNMAVLALIEPPLERLTWNRLYLPDPSGACRLGVTAAQKACSWEIHPGGLAGRSQIWLTYVV